MENQFEIKKSEWKNETEKRRNNLVEFLKNNIKVDLNERSHYDSMSDLHFSGTNRVVFDEIAEGTANLISIETFYINGEIEQIHMVFDGENQGQNIDVYLKKKALEDYLKENDNSVEVLEK